MKKPRQQFKGDHAAAVRKMDTMHGKLTNVSVEAKPKVEPAPVASKTSHVVYAPVDSKTSNVLYGVER
jgi:hypothetical protein